MLPFTKHTLSLLTATVLIKEAVALSESAHSSLEPTTGPTLTSDWVPSQFVPEYHFPFAPKIP